MSNGDPPGPEVDAIEDLQRCITTPAWWVPEEGRPSSAAFKHPDFSTDISSIAGSADYTLRRFPAGCGLVAFNYGDAKALGFLARQELDPEFPDNIAHANVYSSPSASKHKTMAQKLAQLILEKGGILVEPSFAP
jgi:hypothetical protein